MTRCKAVPLCWLLNHPFANIFCCSRSAFLALMKVPYFGHKGQLRENWPKALSFFLSHYKKLSIRKSTRIMLCEVKLHLAPSSVLIIFACPLAQYHTGSYLLMTTNLLHRLANFGLCFRFWVAGPHTYIHIYASEGLLFRLCTHTKRNTHKCRHCLWWVVRDR